MNILPVLDVLNGIVVRGVAGRRETYRPIDSVLTPSSVPLDVARAFRRQLDLSEFYLADLDAITRGHANLETYRALASEGFSLMVDAGLHRAGDASGLLEAGAESVIAGLETLSDPRELETLCRAAGADRAVFSLDLQNGHPLGDLRPWGTFEPFALAEQAVQAGIRRIIVLDLAGVGVGAGVVTKDLCVRIRKAFPDVQLITGGGVRGGGDLAALAELGVDGVLIASALHGGAIGRETLDEFRQPSSRPLDSMRSKTRG